MGITAESILDQVFALAQDEVSDDGVWTKAQAVVFLNRAMRDVSGHDRLQKSWSTAITAGSESVSLPADWIKPVGDTVYIDSVEQDFTTESGLSGYDRNWKNEDAASDTRFVYIKAGSLYVWPTPTDNLAIIITYYCLPATVTAAGAGTYGTGDMQVMATDGTLTNGVTWPNMEAQLVERILNFYYRSDEQLDLAREAERHEEKADSKAQLERNRDHADDTSAWSSDAKAAQNYADSYGYN